MKPKTLILTVVAVTCGLGASYMTSRLLADRAEAPQEKAKILVAKKALDQGLPIKDIESVFTIKEVPAEMVEKDNFRPEDVEKLKGLVLRRALRANDPVRQDDFLGEEKTMAHLMSQGYRAIGIRVNQESIASGWAALPMSRVDIISTVRRSNDKDSFSQILLENVLVLAADQTNTTDGSGRPISANVVTVALKPDDLLKVTLARELGPLSLVLRKFNDSSKVDSDGKVTVEQLLTKSGEKKDTESAWVESTGQPLIAPPEPKMPPAEIKPIVKLEPPPVVKDEPKVQPKVEPKVVALPGRPHVLKILAGDQQHTFHYRLDENDEVIRPADGTRSEPPPPRPQGTAPAPKNDEN